MKIRKQIKKTYFLLPNKPEGIGRGKQFKYKKDLMKYLNSNILDFYGGLMFLRIETPGMSYTSRYWRIKYDFRGNKGVVLKQESNREFHKISKKDKKWFAFSEKIIYLMSSIGEEETEEKLINLIHLFYKRGWNDFSLDSDEKQFVESYLTGDKEIPWFHWSDRCNGSRTKVIVEYFKKNYPIK